MTMRKNWMTTLGGILAGLGTLPLLATASHVALPLWWNSWQFPLFLCGAVGTILMGATAKDFNSHSTQQQIQAATAQRQAEVQVKTADEVAPIEKVEVVNPPAAVKGVILPKPVPKPAIVPKPKA